MSQAIGIHLYCQVVQASFYSTMVECFVAWLSSSHLSIFISARHPFYDYISLWHSVAGVMLQEPNSACLLSSFMVL